MNQSAISIDVKPDAQNKGIVFFLKNLAWLYLKPKKFFANLDSLNVNSVIYIALWLFGMSNVVDKIDQKLMKVDLGTASNANQVMVNALSDGWLWFCLLVGGAGLISAFFTWLIGGWFYNLRLSWSGAKDFDKDHGRIVYLFSSIVYIIPHIIILLAYTVLYTDYVDAHYADEYWSSIIILFPFWSIFVSYTGLKHNFDVVKWKALLWFVILPLAFYLVAFGAVIWLFANNVA